MISELTKRDIIALTNESKRKSILAGWRSWAIWLDEPEIGLTVRRLNLPDGSFFTASWNADYDTSGPRFNYAAGPGRLKGGSVAESVLTDKLKELRKALIENEM